MDHQGRRGGFEHLREPQAVQVPVDVGRHAEARGVPIGGQPALERRVVAEQHVDALGPAGRDLVWGDRLGRPPRAALGPGQAIEADRAAEREERAAAELEALAAARCRTPGATSWLPSGAAACCSSRSKLSWFPSMNDSSIPVVSTRTEATAENLQISSPSPSASHCQP